MKPSLPIDAEIENLCRTLKQRGTLVLQAPTGSGKTTRLPPAVLDRVLAPGESLILLEPRRLAARAAARRIAAERGEAPGRTVGFQIRFERCASAETRLLVVTEGILTRRLRDDPFLEGVGAVILDEFHERSLHADLALALLRELRATVRPDLRLVVMSATLAAEPVATFLGGAPIHRVEGRTFPVELDWIERPVEGPMPPAVAAAVEGELDRGEGDLLVFLPGAGEIAACADRLQGSLSRRGIELLRLHGDLPAEQQDRALGAGERRRVILSTNVAETSVTLEGVRGVIDAGWVRRSRVDPETGIERLRLERISRASAEQRAGRAGRQAPGRALRLWTRLEHQSLEDEELPEILRVDLARTVLEMVSFGVADPAAFSFLSPPPAAALGAAVDLLIELGALARCPGGLRATKLGEEIAGLPLHPRWGRVALEARSLGVGREGAILAALASERDIALETRAFARGPREKAERRRPGRLGRSDLLDRLDSYVEAERRGFAPADLRRLGLDPRSVDSVRRAQNDLQRALGRAGSAPDEEASEEALLRAVLSGFPDRVARRREPGSALARMTGGKGLRLADTSVVVDETYFCAVELAVVGKGREANAEVRLASGIEESWLDDLFPGAVRSESEAIFDPGRETVVGRRRRLYRDLVLEEKTGVEVDPEVASAALAAALRAEPSRVLPREGALPELLERAAFLRREVPEADFPVLDEAFVIESLADSLSGRRSFAELRAMDLVSLVTGRLEHRQRQILAAEAPLELALPGGRRVRIRYEKGLPPVAASRIQDFFGLWRTPRVARGRVPLRLELLAPNGRPVQITSDLESFWRRTWTQVRKDLRGRYPKHAWPETPPAET